MRWMDENFFSFRLVFCLPVKATTLSNYWGRVNVKQDLIGLLMGESNVFSL